VGDIAGSRVLAAFLAGPQHVLDIDEPDNLTAVVGIDHRIAGVSFVENDRPDIRHRRVGRDAHNVRSRDHDLPNDRIVEIEHALDHVDLRRVDVPLFARPGQYSAYLALAERLVRLRCRRDTQ